MVVLFESHIGIAERFSTVDSRISPTSQISRTTVAVCLGMRFLSTRNFKRANRVAPVPPKLSGELQLLPRDCYHPKFLQSLSPLLSFSLSVVVISFLDWKTS